MYRIAFVCSVLLLVTTSCNSGTRTVKPPSIDPAEAAAAAIKAYDGDGNGSLDKADLVSTALNLKLWDADGDGAVGEAEIADRLEKYIDSGVGIASVTAFVAWNDKPLPGAKVEFEPEAFMSSVAPSSGTTDAGGAVQMSVASDLLPHPNVKGIQPGLYKVRITHPEIALPEKYNTNTTLTYEYSPLDTLPEPVFELKK